MATTPNDFVGRDKETSVFRRLRAELELTALNISLWGPDSQRRFGGWSIDLVCETDSCCLAVEGKFKTMRDGAVPDNRKAAFFDLFKLEQYVASGEYHAGLFLWLTDEPKYRIQASGDSAEFSMHEGRSYRSGTALRAKRARNRIPLPLVLRQDYTFRWTRTDSARGWYDLVIATQDKQR